MTQAPDFNATGYVLGPDGDGDREPEHVTKGREMELQRGADTWSKVFSDKISPAQEEADRLAWPKKEMDALRMAVAGKTYSEIARELGIHPRTVKARIDRVLEKTARKAGVDNWRARQLLRYETILSRLWPMIETTDTDDKGELRPPSFAAIDKATGIMAAERAMMGLDRPKNYTVKVKNKDASKATRTVSDVAEYMTLADRLLAGGLGSGRTEEEQSRVIDAVVVEREFSPSDDDDSDSDDDSEDDYEGEDPLDD